MAKKTYLSDSFESQKRIAHEISDGFLAKEITVGKKTNISQSELSKAKARGNLFVKKYGL